MDIAICIPTCKNRSEILNQENEALSKAKLASQIHVSTQKVPASVNRNNCLNSTANFDVIIMMDDDITGFYPGWDEDLLRPLLSDERIGIVVARLLKPDRSIAFMSGDTGDLESYYFDVKDKHLCTACFAMRKNGLRYDETFLGSGFEDTDFGLQFVNTFPEKRIVINNTCKLIHSNEMKNQGGPYWEHNKNHFLSKHPNVKDTWHD